MAFFFLWLRAVSTDLEIGRFSAARAEAKHLLVKLVLNHGRDSLSLCDLIALVTNIKFELCNLLIEV